MRTFERKSLQSLLEQKTGPCVSIFLPTHPSGPDTEQDAIRFKNLINEANRQLSEKWMRGPEAEHLLESASQLPGNLDFWQNRSTGMAIFVAPRRLDTYRVGIPFAEHVSVGHRFRVRPLLPLVEHHLSFLLLCISENLVRMYVVDEGSIEKVEVPGLPTKLSDLLCYVGADRGAQVHTAMHGVSGKQGAVFHGQGGEPDTAKEEQLAFCDAINDAVTTWLGQSTQPLLLAAVESLSAIYRKKNTYKHLLDVTLFGNHDYESLSELHEKAWAAVQPLQKQEAVDAAQHYSNLLGTNRASDASCQIVSAAMEGRIDTLLYDQDGSLFGTWDMATQCIKVTDSADRDDLIEMAAVETLTHGGTVYALAKEDMPTSAPLAAILRY
jgi:hypothetical protein